MSERSSVEKGSNWSESEGSVFMMEPFFLGSDFGTAELDGRNSERASQANRADVIEPAQKAVVKIR